MSDRSEAAASVVMPIPDGDERFEIRITRLTIAPPGHCLFSEMSTDVELDDEAGGEFVVIRQKSTSTEAQLQAIRVAPEEWPSLRKCVDYLMSMARNE